MSDHEEPPVTARPDQPQPDTRADHRLVAKEGGWAGMLSLVGAAIRYGNNIILTRMLGARLYGLYALANTVVTVATVPSTLGLPISLVHFLASSSERGEWGRLRWMLRASFRAVLISSLLGVVVVLALAPWASRVIFKKEGLLLPLGGLALALPLLALYLVCAGGLQGLRFIRGKVFIERIAHPLVFTVLLLVGGYFFRNIEYVLVCFFVAAAVVLALGFFWLRRRMSGLPQSPFPGTAWRELLGFSTPLMFMNFLNFFILWSDILVMGMFRPAVEVGIYAIASRLATGVNMPTDSLGASLAPSFSSLTGREDMEGLRRLFHTSTRWIFLLSSFAGLGLALGGHAILGIFGPEFQRGYAALCLLAGGQVITALFGANGTLITMTGHPRINLANSVVLGLGNLGLNLLLVPRYGPLGAASAAALSWAVVNTTRAVEIWFILKIGPWDRAMVKPLLSFLAGAVIGGAVLWAAGSIAAALAGLCAFALCWWVLRPEPEDADMLRRGWSRLRRHPA